MRKAQNIKAILAWANQFKFLLMFFLLFSAAVIMQRRVIQTETFSVDSKHIEIQIHNLETELVNLVSETKKNYLDGIFFETDSLSTWMIEKDYSEYTNRGFSVLVYKNDTLRFWSENTVPVPHYLSDNEFFNKKIVQLGNGWFLIDKAEIENGLVIGLLRIKNNYTYENRFLDNSYREDLAIPSSVKISDEPSTYGKIIRNKNGDPIFSLVPVSNVIPVRELGAWVGILYFLSFAFLFLFANEMFKRIAAYQNGEWYLVLLTLIIIMGRIAMIRFKFPFFVYSLVFFEPEIYAGYQFSPHIGDLLLNAVVLLFLSANLFRIFPIEKILSKLHEKSVVLFVILQNLLLFAVGFYLAWISNITNDLVQNSNIELRIHLITKIDIFSIISYIILGLLFTSVVIPTDRLLKLYALHSTYKRFLLYFLPVYIVAVAVYYFIHNFDYQYLALVYAALILFVSFTRFIGKEYRYFNLAILVVLFSTHIVLTVYTYVEENKNDESKILITQLEDERDLVAELLLSEIGERMNTDPMLIRMITNTIPDHKLTVHDYLKRKYFFGFWEKYKLTTTLCGNVLTYPEANQAENCERYFLKNIKEFGHKLENSDFYFIGNRDGTITYFGKFSVPVTLDERRITVYIQLKEILSDIRLGYPDLLIDESDVSKNIFADYSYAKYRKGKLVSKSGDFPFDLNDRAFSDFPDGEFVRKDGYLHHLHRGTQGNLIVLSRLQIKPFEYLTAFAYLFVFLNVILLPAVVVSNPSFLLKKFKPDFKNRIRFSMLFILLVTFLLFTGGTIFYAVLRHQEIQNEQLAEKMQSVITELKHKLAAEDKLTPEWKSPGYEHLDELLIKFSQIFFVDINVYDLNGFLLATSRPEVFERGLISKEINRNAYNSLVFNKKALLIQKEHIGLLNYSSVYIPFENKDNQVLAYVNLPYFTDDDNLQKNISNLLITTINIYVILFLIALVIAFFISTNITRPLRMLQSKFKNVELGKKHQEIKYKKDDEVGALVAEYNRMVEELEISVKKLAESERENAWREMAKQIAHEIKNPLTPMKLSVQLLQRSWADNKEDFETRLTNVAQTLIEQIDTLSSIASEFSAFAKMPKAQDEEVNLGAKLKTVVQLFQNTRDIDVKLELHGNENVSILADKEQLSRVFINIVKNGIQSIPEGIHGKIYVELTTYGNYAKITIEDNGSGIPDDKKGQLFKPSFTTKTTGMGMGLAIVKNIVNSANGEIWFESELGKGTKFFIEFPILTNSND